MQSMNKPINHESATISGESEPATARLLRLKEEIDAKLVELSRLQASDELANEIAFVAEFNELRKKYQFDLNDAFAMMDPGHLFGTDFDAGDFFEALQVFTSKEKCNSDVRKGRALMRYRNPFTGEVVETKGTNHKKLKEWKATHGRQVVESWKEE